MEVLCSLVFICLDIHLVFSWGPLRPLNLRTRTTEDFSVVEICTININVVVVVVVVVFTLKTVLTSIQYPSLSYSSRQRNEFPWSHANPK